MDTMMETSQENQQSTAQRKRKADEIEGEGQDDGEDDGDASSREGFQEWDGFNVDKENFPGRWSYRARLHAKQCRFDRGQIQQNQRL
ncbi:unnamed protein product [Brassica napus]|uniref:(rape) hypothetical protein n=1 Tax=Brassica napus TaxID=3708 RepID=A0A816L6F3_BRANA|nr:unnamed protein product [Brassica napus]